MLSTQHFLHWAKKGDSHWVLNPGCMVDVVTPQAVHNLQSPAQCVVERCHTKESLLTLKSPFCLFRIAVLSLSSRLHHALDAFHCE